MKSEQVSPVAQLPSHLPHSIPQILINLDPISHVNFDIQLLGDGDTIIRYLTSQLGSSYDLDTLVPVVPIPPHALSESLPGSSKVGGQNEGEGWEGLEKELKEGAEKELEKRVEGLGETVVPERVGNSHAWLFPGFVDRENRWLKAVRKAYDDETDSDSVHSPSTTTNLGAEFEGMEEGEKEVVKELVVEEGEKSRKWEEDIVVDSKRQKFE